MIKDILTDIVAHTHSLGFIPFLKVTGTDQETKLESAADDKSVVIEAKMKNPITEFDGVFGMGSLDVLNLHLKNPEYKENALIEVNTTKRNGEEVPTSITFTNETGDFSNEFRFVSTDIINEKIKSLKLKSVTWDVEFTPSVVSVQRLKLQAQAHSGEPLFQVKMENKNLVFSFGDASNHAGSFIFQSAPGGKLKNVWTWDVQQVLAILNLNGDCVMKISDQGAMQIVIDSGLGEYSYILPPKLK
jgi:hypothetical protein